MTGYAQAPADVEAAAEEKSAAPVQQRRCAARLLKPLGVLLVGALCLAGVLLVAYKWAERREAQMEAQSMEGDAVRKEPHHTLRQISSKAKAAIHLVGSYDDDDNNAGSKKELQWMYDQGQAFVQGGFQLANNQIVIPHSGLYFIYSQASFRVSCSDEGEGHRPPMPLSHRVWCHSDSMGGKASLMSAVRSACQSGGGQEDGARSGHGWYNAIYLGAVFQLNSGDKLWTETSQLSELEADEGKTFFGVFAL
ncbi:tumor necrosis factor-like [Pholidichthys leucotaenia]